MSILIGWSHKHTKQRPNHKCQRKKNWLGNENEKRASTAETSVVSCTKIPEANEYIAKKMAATQIDDNKNGECSSREKSS